MVFIRNEPSKRDVTAEVNLARGIIFIQIFCGKRCKGHFVALKINLSGDLVFHIIHRK